MKPNPITALIGSRKVIISLGALLGVVVIYGFTRLSPEEKAGAVAAITALAWKLMGTIALEDAADKGAAKTTVTQNTSPGAPTGDIAISYVDTNKPGGPS